MEDINVQLIEKINNKTKPLGSLGVLEELALQIGTIQNTLTPTLNNPHMLVFAADHGLTEEGVSPFPKEVTQQMVLNFLSGGAAINVFCKQHNITIKVVDAGVDGDFSNHEGLVKAKVSRGTANILKQPAMSSEECEEAMKTGEEIVEKAHNKGCNIIGFGEMGIGNTSSAALIMNRICKFPLELCVGKGTGLDNEGVKHKLNILSKAVEKHSNVTDAFEILQTFGGLEIAMMSGAFLRAHELNMIILVDGFIATSALLIAQAINKNALKNCIFSHLSNEQGHKKMLDYLKAKPLLNLNMRLGEGTGAAVAFPIVQSAVNFLNEMASFESAGVSNSE